MWITNKELQELIARITEHKTLFTVCTNHPIKIIQDSSSGIGTATIVTCSRCELSWNITDYSIW